MKTRRIGKKGAEKYYLIVSIILGLILLIIALFWIFQEYFGQDEINWETCRQSIILRASMPESERIATRTIENLRNNFPLKCKTEVVEVNIPEKIDNSFSQNVSELIAQKMNECWSLFGEGKYLVFPIRGLTDRSQKNCVACARIHFPIEAEKISENYRTARVMSYFFTHYLGGKEIPESKAIFKKEGTLITYNNIENSYASYLNFLGGVDKEDKTLFPGSDEWWDSKTGRMTIDISKGDVIIGVYSYTDTQLSRSWPPITAYRWMRPFYAQIGVDDLNGCGFDGVPA